MSKVDPESGLEAASFYELTDNNWDFVLSSALKEHQCQNLNATVTLGSHLYQSYQIDKPAIPKEEWSVALPFLLKDLITERVNEIVADGVELADSNKIQAYVVIKRFVEQLKQVLDHRSVKLLNITPEDEVWAHARSDVPAYMLLHRSQNSEFKIGAFVNQSSAFQRTVRGVESPITGEFASSLQIDALALELQRSMDYLSAQLKQVQINKLFLCCDDENTEELREALQERLNVMVEPLLLSDVTQKSGEVLVYEAYQLGLKGVNLYPAHLQPKKEVFNLDLVAVSWALLFLLMMVIYSVYNYKNNQLDSQIAVANGQATELTNEVAVLNKKLAAHKPSPAKLAAVERLRDDVKTKQASLKVISSFDSQLQVGYSGIMSGLASIDRHDISLTSIDIKNGKMNIQGLAKSPEVIPSWVQQFKNEMNLVGRTFERLSIGRDENNVVIFSLRSKDGDDN
ncbi:MSHA biogenesis protein MshI [Vibrio sp. CK2-1]|uniref:MSHA biogenesis protein MshI n=1 Tax=Vibrio sp. CK2-1 TaxID=2912249 RepID=UPI001F2C12F4|nr:MSHA biogenesis protein MshI [Vibrio sp. CK2-1]MCF7353818.1 MSHA biogenesis protein MshI [Vibrio sp. CK2-1]